MSRGRIVFPAALVLSLVFHAALLTLGTGKTPPPPLRPLPAAKPLVVGFVVAPGQARRPAAKTRRPRPKDRGQLAQSGSPPPAPLKKPASMPAPPAPSAEEWKLASTYTLKNSKRYRHDWGQQVRSMMGTAVEGPQQGMVRFHIEIAPDGRITKIEELWATSKQAEKLAWEAIRSLPPLPPTPTGRPLVFEQTIAFEPFDTGWPPNYKFDYLPDPPEFHNPFAQGVYAHRYASQEQPESVSTPGRVPPPTAGSEPDSGDPVDTEDADLNRQIDVWGRGRLNGVK